MRSWHLLLLVLVAYALSGAAFGQDLAADLSKFNELRKAPPISCEKADHLAQDLLNRHVAPAEKAQIYFHAAHFFAQSGQVKPEKTAFYAEKALGFPQESMKKAELYLYWGDAVSIGDRKRPLAKNRKAAAAIYLEGLKFLEGLNLPEQLPTLPTPPKVKINDPMFAKLFHQYQEAKAKADLPESTKKLMFFRDVLVGQVAYVYRGQPFDNDELAALANEKLKDKAMVKKLLAKAELTQGKEKQQIARAQASLKKAPIITRLPTADDKGDLGRFYLRFDKRLGVKLRIVERDPSLADLLDRLQTATGLTFTMDDKLKYHEPSLGWLDLPSVAAWSVMEKIAQTDLEDGRWTQTETGYMLTGTSKALKVPPRRSYWGWFGGGAGLLLVASVGYGIFRWRRKSGVRSQGSGVKTQESGAKSKGPHTKGGKHATPS